MKIEPSLEITAFPLKEENRYFRKAPLSRRQLILYVVVYFVQELQLYMHNQVALWSCAEFISWLLWLGTFADWTTNLLIKYNIPLEEKVSVNKFQIAAN